MVMRMLMVTTVAMAGLAQLSSSWARAAGGAIGGSVWAGYGRWMLMIMVLMMMMMVMMMLMMMEVLSLPHSNISANK
jgi:hypothetical protein